LRSWDLEGVDDRTRREIQPDEQDHVDQAPAPERLLGARVGLRRDAMVLHQLAREVIGARFLRVLEIRRLARCQGLDELGDSPTSFPTRRWANSSYSEPQAAPTVRMMIS
jgi:hypothetical protein